MDETIQTDPIPEVVREYARERGVEGYLEPLLEAVRRNFPGSSPYLVIEEDPEVEDLRHIVALVRNLYDDVDSALAARAAYYRDLVAIVPPPLLCEFRLGLE